MRSSTYPNTYSKPEFSAGFFLILVFVFAVSTPATASWLIDSERHHVSAHGSLVCVDCHGDIPSLTPHPDPSSVNRKRDKPGYADVCLACHDTVADGLAQGSHGGLAVHAPDEYRDCLACHDPHYALSSVPDAPRFDPSLPVSQRCSVCHAFRDALPLPSVVDGADGRCMSCHQRPDFERPEEHGRIQALCFRCHGRSGPSIEQGADGQGFFIDREAYRFTPHAVMACLACHPEAARYGHVPQRTEACETCHTRHDEKTAHDAHLNVGCKACHLPQIRPVRHPETGLIVEQRERRPGELTDVHDFMTEKDLDSCRRCHVAGNSVGAAAMVPPPKSILCMPCHAATFSVGDTVTLLSLLIFGAGMVLVLSYVFSGGLPGNPKAGIFSKIGALLGGVAGVVFSGRIWIILKALFWDVLLQRRLYRRSPLRWTVHSLIFMPFLIRFTWGMTGLVSSLRFPEWAGTWMLLNKNHPMTALVFDITGVMILAGVIWAFLRDRRHRRVQPADLSGQDRLALLLIGLLVLAGFVLEGVRIAMTGTPPGARWAFIGYAFSGLFKEAATPTTLYGYIWYLHAGLSGAFVAYLPFSRLLHIILAPITLSMQAVLEHEHKRKSHG